MEKSVRILVADDNRNFIHDLDKYLQSEDGLELVNFAQNGMQALQLIQQENPDIVILDMIIPQMDGLEVLERLQKEQQRPRVIIISELGQESIIKQACALGADYYMLKPFELEILVKRIRQVCGQIPVSVSSTNREKKTVNSLENESKKIINWEIQVTHLLNKMGVPPQVKGYGYLWDSIVLVLHDTSTLDKLKRDLYPRIAEKHKVNQQQVESRIQYAIDLGWKNGNRKFMIDFFKFNMGSNPYKPTNLEFIATVADKLRISQFD